MALFLGTCGLSATLARAQERDGAGTAPNEFSFNVGLGGGFTSNPSLQSGGGSNGDSISDLRADLLGRKKSPRTEWSAGYDSFYTRYGTNGQFDTINQALNFDGRYLVTRRSRLALFEHFFYSRNPLRIETAEPADEAVILTRQTKRWRSISDAELDTRLSRSLTLKIGTSARTERFDLDPPVNTDVYSARFGIQKQVGQKDNIASTYSYSRFGFHQEGVADAEAQAVNVSWSRTAPAQTDWGLSAGVSNVLRGGARQNRVVAAASLHHPFRRLDVVSGYRRSIDADTGATTLTLAQNAYAGISVRVGQRTSLGLFGEYGTRDSILEGGERLALSYIGGAMRGSFTFNPRLSISGEARRRKQDVTAGAGDGLTVDTVFIGLVFRVV